MSMQVGIQGIGMVGPWGDDLASFLDSYQKRSSAFVPVERFDVSQVAVKDAALIKDFEPKKYMDAKNVRKYDLFSRLGIAASRLALNSSEKKYSPEELADMGIVVSCETQSMITGSYLDGLVRDGVDQVSPKLFSVAAANSANCNIAIETGVQGPSVNVSAKFAAGFLSAYTGAQLIAAGQVKECLAVSIDYLSQIVMEAYTRMGCYQHGDEPKSGFRPGEGTAALLLSKDDSSCGNILGFGYECSAQENYRWPVDADTQTSVLKKAMGNHQVDKFQSAANGNADADAIDRIAYNKIFSLGKNSPEFISIKDQLGEFSSIPLFQIIAACTEPAGIKTLISVLSPGGVHGAILVESTGWARA